MAGVRSWADSSRRSELTKGLKAVSWAPLSAVFAHPSGQDKPVFAILAEALQELMPHEWSRFDHNGALKRAVAAAIFRLPDDVGPKDSSMSWRNIGFTLYGYRGIDRSVAPVVGKEFDYLRKIVFESMPNYSESHQKRKILEPLYKMLAAEFACLHRPSKERRGSMSFAETSALLLLLRGTSDPQASLAKAEAIDSIERSDPVAFSLLFAATYAERLLPTRPIEEFLWAYVRTDWPNTTLVGFQSALDRLESYGLISRTANHSRENSYLGVYLDKLDLFNRREDLDILYKQVEVHRIVRTYLWTRYKGKRERFVLGLCRILLAMPKHKQYDLDLSDVNFAVTSLTCYACGYFMLMELTVEQLDMMSETLRRCTNKEGAILLEKARKASDLHMMRAVMDTWIPAPWIRYFDVVESVRFYST